MITYNKIETVYNRDIEGTKKLIEGSFRNETVEYLKDNIWIWTEKIDGTNIRVHWDGHKVEFGGRTDKAQIPNHLLERLEELFGGNDNEEFFEQMFGEKEVYLFGEGYGPKIQKVGSQYRDDVDFILFDIMINGNYQPREVMEQIAKALGIDCVPIILEGSIQHAIDFVKIKPISTIGNAPMEGLVGRPKLELRDRTNNRLIVKVKVCDFT